MIQVMGEEDCQDTFGKTGMSVLTREICGRLQYAHTLFVGEACVLLMLSSLIFRRGGRYERSHPPGRSFDDDIISPPHREFSRSMSSENWRETKREEDDDTDRRRAPARERWGEHVIVVSF